MKHSLPFYLLLLLLCFSCSPEEENLPEPLFTSDEVPLVSFSFLKEHNAALPADIKATVSGKSITILLPPGIAPDSLVASFATHGPAKVFIGKKEQVSGVTANNYPCQLVYKFVSETGNVSRYNLELISAFPELDNALGLLMKRYAIPGVSVAIVKNEKLVFSKSYGFADTEGKFPVNNESLFRIASITKPITAIAIYKLVQENKLRLQDRVFGPGSIFGDAYGAVEATSQVSQITVQHLLDHTSGWVNDPNDPMLSDNTLSQKQLILHVVQNRTLKYKPGSTYSYSNIGYCILGRIIEKVSGKPYADYVGEEILLPSGIEDMSIAGNTLTQRKPNEVKYYQKEWSPYGLNISRMDSHGGWLASATDLMRLMVRIDRNPGKQDLVESTFLDDTYFASPNWSHSGSLPGTSTFITRLNNEYSFVVLANSRINADTQLFFNEFYAAMKQNILKRSAWSGTDLFDING